MAERETRYFHTVITLGLHLDSKQWHAEVRNSSGKVLGGDQPKIPYRRAAPLLEKNPDLPDLCLN